MITDAMVDRALNAWFASPPSETDQGLARSMRAALEAALNPTTACPVCGRTILAENVEERDKELRDRAYDCPCGGWDCSGLPGGPLYGCPYVAPSPS
jgi:hypothetical protein